MEKAVYGGSLASTAFLLAGTYLFPASPIMWLAGMSLAYTIFRLVMVAMLVTVIFTTPPRKMFIRFAMGVLAAVLVSWGVALMLQGSYKLLDMILFVELGIAFGLGALEVNEADTENIISPNHRGVKAA